MNMPLTLSLSMICARFSSVLLVIGRCFLVAAALGFRSVTAQLTLEFGDASTLLPISNFIAAPGQAQTIGILVNNTGAAARLSGYTLEVALGGGGVVLGGVAGPMFTGVDMVTGTPFVDDHSTPTVNGGPNPFPGLGSAPQYLGLSLTTIHAAVPPETLGAVDLPSGRSLLLTLSLSTAGFSAPQAWNLAVVGAGTGSFFNDANNNILVPSVQDSTISVVPEPRAYSWAAGLSVAAFALARRLWVKA